MIVEKRKERIDRWIARQGELSSLIEVRVTDDNKVIEMKLPPARTLYNFELIAILQILEKGEYKLGAVGEAERPKPTDVIRSLFGEGEK